MRGLSPRADCLFITSRNVSAVFLTRSPAGSKGPGSKARHQELANESHVLARLCLDSEEAWDALPPGLF